MNKIKSEIKIELKLKSNQISNQIGLPGSFNPKAVGPVFQRLAGLACNVFLTAPLPQHRYFAR